MEEPFLRTMAECYEAGISLDFVVCPDIPQSGLKSLQFSMEWATGRLRSCPNLALVVQDGMTPKDITPYHLQHFKTLFIGGSLEWKWRTLESWAKFAHYNRIDLHVGQASTTDRLIRCRNVGAKSADSVSFVRQQKWHLIDNYHGNGQQQIFDNPTG